jgi:hypothetical protein
MRLLLVTAVSETLPAEFWQGVEQFNNQQYYACHDTLEALWMEAIEPDKTFYQGILQIAVALYHFSNANLRGATILLGEGIHRLSRYQPAYADIDVKGFLTQSVLTLKTLQQASLDPTAATSLQLDLTQFKILRLEHEGL